MPYKSRKKKMPGMFIRMNIDTSEQFADMIYKFRLRAGFSLWDMALYIGGLSAATVQRWEKRGVIPRSGLVIGKLIDRKIIHELYRSNN